LTAGNTPKPIQTGFEMLAQLQPKRLKVLKSKKSSRLGIIATGSKEKIVLLLYNYEESDEEQVSGNDIINIQLSGLENKSNYKVESLVLDEKSNNTYQSWKTMGSPKNSKSIDLTTLKKAATLDVSKHFELETNADGQVNLAVNLKRRSAQILLIHPND
jgi:beta-xylosidase